MNDVLRKIVVFHQEARYKGSRGCVMRIPVDDGLLNTLVLILETLCCDDKYKELDIAVFLEQLNKEIEMNRKFGI